MALSLVWPSHCSSELVNHWKRNQRADWIIDTARITDPADRLAIAAAASRHFDSNTAMHWLLIWETARVYADRPESRQVMASLPEFFDTVAYRQRGTFMFKAIDAALESSIWIAGALWIATVSPAERLRLIDGAAIGAAFVGYFWIPVALFGRTLAMAVLGIAVVIIAGASRKSEPKSGLKVDKLNERYGKMARTLKAAMLMRPRSRILSVSMKPLPGSPSRLIIAAGISRLSSSGRCCCSAPPAARPSPPGSGSLPAQPTNRPHWPGPPTW